MSICPWPPLTSASSDRSTPAKRQMLDHVSVPPRRSKLSTEKTTSADNLTLDSRLNAATKLEMKEEVKEEEEGDTTESDPNRPDVNSPAGDTEDDMDVKSIRHRRRVVAVKNAESSEDERPLANTRRTRPTRASTGKTRRTAIPITSGSEELDDDADRDYAMDSDDEVAQLHRAIEASQAEDDAGSSTRTGRSSSTRSRRTTSSAKSTPKSTPKTTPKKQAGKGATPHRAAIARAAQRTLLSSKSMLTPVRMRSSRGQSSTSGTTLATPLDSSASPEFIPDDDDEYDDSAFSDSPLSAPSDDDDDDAEDYVSDEEKPKKPQKKKAKGKTFRLDGGKTDPLPDSWKHKTAAEREAEIERINDEKALIRKKEAKLKKKLGRKLTQGERNQIRLSLVSYLAGWELTTSTTPSSSTAGEISRPTSSPSSLSPWRPTLLSNSPSFPSRRRVCTG